MTLEEVDGYCKSLGMANTHHRFLIPPLALAADHPLKTVTTTSAADQVLLLQTILDAQSSPEAQAKLGCSPQLCEWAMQTLKNQILRYGIRSRLPFEAVVASKSGRGDGAVAWMPASSTEMARRPSSSPPIRMRCRR